MLNKFNLKSILNWFKSNWPIVLGFLALFVYLVAICFRLDPDFGWHLRVGEDLLKNHIFPRTDFYTFPFQGYAWRDHEWLAEGPLWWIYRQGGYLPLVMIFSCLWFLPFWWLVREKNLVLKLLAIMVALAAITPFMGVRLQVLTLVGLAFLFRLFTAYFEKNRKLLLYLFPLIMLFWANIHGSFVYGLLIGFIFLIYCFIKDTKKAWPFLISYIIGLAVTLINPYGIGLWQEIIAAANPAYKSMIAEWVNLFELPVSYFIIFYLIFFLVFWLANPKSKLSFPAYYIVSVFIFLILGIISRRNITIFILLSLPVFVELLRTDLLLYKIKKRQLIILLAEVVFASALIIVFASQLFIYAGRQNIFAGSYDSYPNAKIVSTLAKLPQGAPVFASYDWGGYLIQSNPNIKVLIDGRASYWKLDGGLAVRKYFDMLLTPAAFKTAQSEYGFEVVVAGGLTSEPQFDYIFQKDLTNNIWQDFSLELLKSGDWKLIAKNENNSQELFVLRNSQSEKLLGGSTTD